MCQFIAASVTRAGASAKAEHRRQLSIRLRVVGTSGPSGAAANAAPLRAASKAGIASPSQTVLAGLPASRALQPPHCARPRGVLDKQRGRSILVLIKGHVAGGCADAQVSCGAVGSCAGLQGDRAASHVWAIGRLDSHQEGAAAGARPRRECAAAACVVVRPPMPHHRWTNFRPASLDSIPAHPPRCGCRSDPACRRSPAPTATAARRRWRTAAGDSQGIELCQFMSIHPCGDMLPGQEGRLQAAATCQRLARTPAWHHDARAIGLPAPGLRRHMCCWPRRG